MIFPSGSGTSFSGKHPTDSSFSVEDFLPFLSQTWSSLENHKSGYWCEEFFPLQSCLEKKNIRYLLDCLCLSKPDKPKYFHETESSSFSFGIISFLESQSSGSWRPPQHQPGLLPLGKSLLRAMLPAPAAAHTA